MADQSYRALLGHGHTGRLLAGLSAAWLSYGMVGLALFLTVHRATGSYGLAGVAVAAFSAGSGALAPARGRLVDRRGPRRWLPAFAVCYGSALVLLAALARGGSPGWPLVACAAVAGATAPPLVATIRGLWSGLVEPPLLRRAYALTSLVGDVGAVGAPALGGVLFVAAPWAPLVVCALGACAAAAAVAGAAPPRPPVEGGDPGGSLVAGAAMRTLLVVSVALGAALGLVEVAVPAAATRWGDATYSGFLLGAFALGSVGGALWFAGREWRSPPERRYLVAVSWLALGLAPPLAATGSATLAPLLVVAGAGYGPATIALFEALDALAPARATEALTWVTTAEAIGAAAGAAASGWAATGIGTWAPFATASAVLGAAAAGGLAWHRRRGVV